ncbi:hypothetical protein TIFTF001_026513 [Ficus carica]|uniref:Uncharacterized protein n=1 Tax=Ficus carica TaxID=3494 RepID=A0AA88DLB4_FICCA|nr:hypothetical protein TIFTF001_026513 [Ficus carica]
MKTEHRSRNVETDRSVIDSFRLVSVSTIRFRWGRNERKKWGLKVTREKEVNAGVGEDELARRISDDRTSSAPFISAISGDMTKRLRFRSLPLMSVAGDIVLELKTDSDRNFLPDFNKDAAGSSY